MIKIAIDGPAGSGKSTVSKRIAKSLGINYLDTGAMYRAVTLKLLKEEISFESIERVKRIVDTIDIDFNKNTIYLDGENVSKEIRSQEVTEYVSTVATYSFIREKMVALQQEIAKKSSVIMDGRDIGTHVLPNADYKFYLNASVEERARRRYAEVKDDNDISFDDIVKAIEKRDYKDKNREIAPLVKAEDAIEVDTTEMSIEEVVAYIIGVVGDQNDEIC